MASGIFHGMLAGAVGATALNVATNLDMALRGRPGSTTPEQVVQESARRAGASIPGGRQERDARTQGLGALSGSTVGVAVGAAAGIVHTAVRRCGRHIPAVIAIPLVGAAAMAASDLPLKLLGICAPATWKPKDWASDALPHLAYAALTYAPLPLDRR